MLYAVNDFFIGVKNHASARYAITVNGTTENQSSSGVIVSTPLGRSGWMKSVLAAAAGIIGRLLNIENGRKRHHIFRRYSRRLSGF